MDNDSFLFFRIVAGIAWVAVVAAGVLLIKNYDKLVPKAAGDGENDAQRNYAGFFIFAIWAHAFVLSGSFALFLS